METNKPDDTNWAMKSGQGRRRTDANEDFDFVKTHPDEVHKILSYVPLSGSILDPCCGDGVMAEVLKDYNLQCHSIDIADRGYGETGVDFLMDYEGEHDCVIMNPPYGHLLNPFILKALEVTEKRKGKVLVICRLSFLEGVSRQELVFNEFKPSKIFVYIRKAQFFYGDGSKVNNGMAFCWALWDHNRLNGNPEVFWI